MASGYCSCWCGLCWEGERGEWGWIILWCVYLCVCVCVCVFVYECVHGGLSFEAGQAAFKVLDAPAKGKGEG